MGTVLVIIIPCFIIILLEALRIARLVGGKKDKDSIESKEREIEELKRRLASLEEEDHTDSAEVVGSGEK